MPRPRRFGFTIGFTYFAHLIAAVLFVIGSAAGFTAIAAASHQPARTAPSQETGELGRLENELSRLQVELDRSKHKAAAYIAGIIAVVGLSGACVIEGIAQGLCILIYIDNDLRR